MIVGLTGGIGCGKSTALKFFADLGAVVCSADDITRRLVEKDQMAYNKIVERFGKEILDDKGNLDRSKLRILIFQSDVDRLWLESLLHPAVKTEIFRIAKDIKPGNYLIVEIPLLIEANFQDAVDRVLVIDCSEELQLKRASMRDVTSQEVIKAIIKAQTKRSKRLLNAHDVIVNDKDLGDLKTKVKNMHQFYKEL